MFSLFAGIYFFVKCWLTYKSIMLTEKPFDKKRKTVYDFFFRKPFSLNAPHTHASYSLSLSRPNSLSSSPWATPISHNPPHRTLTICSISHPHESQTNREHELESLTKHGATRHDKAWRGVAWRSEARNTSTSTRSRFLFFRFTRFTMMGLIVVGFGLWSCWWWV